MIEDPIILPNCLKEIKSISILRLPQSNSSKPGLFIIHQSKLYQIQSIQSKANHQHQSWFLKSKSINETDETDLIKDQVISKNAGRILFVTPLNPIYLILNLISQSISSNQFIHSNLNQTFLEIEELIERLLSNWSFKEESSSEEESKPSLTDLNRFQTFLLQNKTYLNSFTDQLIINDETPSQKELYKLSLKKIHQASQTLMNQILISFKNDQIDPNLLNSILIENHWFEIYKTNQPDLNHKLHQMISLKLLETYLPICLHQELSNQFDFNELYLIINSNQVKKDALSNPSQHEFIGLKSNSHTSKSISTSERKKKKISINEQPSKPTGMKPLSSFWKPSSDKKTNGGSSQDTSQ
ncbi:hypothetical protein DFH28DRAFT_1126249 [Melampsora americana]|nr:hypothetical protein DFH28DRAFT_1126249 [Melampsora americana]